MAVDREDIAYMGMFALPVSTILILVATGKFMALVTAISAGGTTIVISAICAAALGFGMGINLLIDGELGRGSVVTMVSGVVLGLTIGIIAGILAPGIGLLIGPLAGAGIGLLAALIPVVVCCIKNYMKSAENEKSWINSSSSECESESSSEMQIQPTNQHSNAFFDKPRVERKQDVDEENNSISICCIQ